MPSSYGSGIDSPSSPTSTMPGQETLKRDAQAVADEAQNVADQIKSEASAQVDQLTGQAKEQLAQATDHVRGIASEQKDLFAGQVGGVADAMGRVASDLESSNAASAQYARMIADNAQKLSSSIHDNSVDELMTMAQDFGRRQPVAFLGAAALLGFAASRFLLASAQRPATGEQAATGDDTLLPATMSDLQPTDFDSGRL
jgi:hypothetical protein